MPNHAPLLPAWDDADGVRRASDLFVAAYGTAPAGVWAAPGRVNLIGEHLDYNGGFSLPFALPHRTFVALAPRADDSVRLVSDLAPDAQWTGSVDDLGPGRASGWIAYAGGPAWVLRDEGFLEELEDELKDSGRYRSWDVSVEDVFIGTDESDCEVRATR